MDIEDLLNTKSPRTAAVQRSATHQMSQAQIAPSGYRMQEHDGAYYPTHEQHPTGSISQQPYPHPYHTSYRPQAPMAASPASLDRQGNPNVGPQAAALPHRSSADGSASGAENNEMPKAFACSTCKKGFARRSDLVRHERIHSGVRPHSCVYPGCGKQFIQRSALTVHERVHTREKPHLCDKCGKPFSDSSSLARHRRIHSGTRPYKCPHADCQKTFTRRTTLTRHMNHHTGTVEESEAARAAALASHAQGQMADASPIDAPDDQSDASSSVSAPHHALNMQANMSRGAPYPQPPGPDYYSHAPNMAPQHKEEMHRYPPPPQMLSPQSQASGASQLRAGSYMGHSPPATDPSLRNAMPGRYDPAGQYAGPREGYSYQESRHANYPPNMYHR